MVSACCLPWASLAATPRLDPIKFTAYRNDSRFGFHTVSFERVDGQLIVSIEISFDYKLAFIPLYRYRHRNREVWLDDQLIEIETETDDNGTEYRVSGKAVDDGFQVKGSSGDFTATAAVQPTSYWRESSLEPAEWLDTQNGNIVRSTLSSTPDQAFPVNGEPVEATAYALEGDITCTLWYHEGRWVGLRFIASDDSVIDYRIEPTL